MLSRALIAATSKPLLLGILAEGETYGYDIIQRVLTLSHGKIQWKTGMIYPMLHRLEMDGLVSTSWHESDKAPKRKYYRLTAKGRKALVHEKTQWFEANGILLRLWGPQLATAGI